MGVFLRKPSVKKHTRKAFTGSDCAEYVRVGDNTERWVVNP